MDTWLRRGALLSQILLFFGAVFGYFYTVRPIHQNQILAEEIGEKEIQLASLQAEIDNFSPNLSDLKSEVSELQSSISKLEISKAGAEATIDELRENRTSLNHQIEKADGRLIQLEENYERVSREVYLESFAGSVSVEFLRTSVNMVNQPGTLSDALESGDVDSIANFLTTPFAAITTVLDEGGGRLIAAGALVSPEIREAVDDEIRAAILRDKYTLDAPTTDIVGLVQRYKIEVQQHESDPTPHDNFNESLHEVNRKYRSALSDAYRAEMRRANTYLERFSSRATDQ